MISEKELNEYLQNQKAKLETDFIAHGNKMNLIHNKKKSIQYGMDDIRFLIDIGADEKKIQKRIDEVEQMVEDLEYLENGDE